MGEILVIGELLDGRPARLTLELASLAARLAAETDGRAAVLLVGGDASAAGEVAGFGPDVLVADPPGPEALASAVVATVATALIGERAPRLVLIGATPEGRAVAGALVGLTGLSILVAANAIRSSEEGGPLVEAATFGGRLITSSVFRDGGGIVLLRPGAAAAEPAPSAGSIEEVASPAAPAVPAVAVVERVTEAAAGPSIDDARVIVGAGRGVGGPNGLALLEDLASALDGAVGATRAVVDAGWIDFGQQIGQTGKSVKPELYVACGISGAIQHKVGVQSANTIVAINRDPDAPITEFADLVVIGDLFEVVPRLTRAIRSARAGS